MKYCGGGLIVSCVEWTLYLGKCYLPSYQRNAQSKSVFSLKHQSGLGGTLDILEKMSFQDKNLGNKRENEIREERFITFMSKWELKLNLTTSKHHQGQNFLSPILLQCSISTEKKKKHKEYMSQENNF